MIWIGLELGEQFGRNRRRLWTVWLAPLALHLVLRSQRVLVMRKVYCLGAWATWRLKGFNKCSVSCD
jgi:hypothetical protein